MELRNGPVILLILIVFAFLGVVCNTTGQAVELPNKFAEAEGTRAAIAPAIVPTVRYNEFVLPTQQAEEANQITATMARRYENARSWSNFVTKCKQVALGALTIFSAIAIASGTGALVGAVVCYVVERTKKARAYEPVQIVPGKPLVFPKWKMLVDPRTGLVIPYTTKHQASVEHGTLLIEAGNGKARARFRFAPRQAERHPAMIEALQRD